MSDHLFDYDTGKPLFPVSDSSAIDLEGHIYTHVSDEFSMDIDTGKLHHTSSWNNSNHGSGSSDFDDFSDFDDDSEDDDYSYSGTTSASSGYYRARSSSAVPGSSASSGASNSSQNSKPAEQKETFLPEKDVIIAIVILILSGIFLNMIFH